MTFIPTSHCDFVERSQGLNFPLQLSFYILYTTVTTCEQPSATVWRNSGKDWLSENVPAFHSALNTDASPLNYYYSELYNTDDKMPLVQHLLVSVWFVS